LRGKTSQNKQRFLCNTCGKSYLWKEKLNKYNREKHWFKLWVKESYSIRQLCILSGYSRSKLQRIKDYWLDLSPQDSFDFSACKYLIYDGTYFHKNGCFINLMNALDQKTISNIYTKKEGYRYVHAWFSNLKGEGLDPLYITMDGEKSVIRAINEIWPQTYIQRCLYHIQREGMRWLRTNPKTQAGKDLRCLLKTLCQINSYEERNEFIASFSVWFDKYRDFVLSLPRTQVAFKDLRRTMGLIFNAMPDMFYYLDDPNIHKTTNTLEGFYSRLKADYRKHRGLSEQHKISYLKWYIYFNNQNT
jgi:hypothetical protein